MFSLFFEVPGLPERGSSSKSSLPSLKSLNPLVDCSFFGARVP